ncbi:MAG: hypothetical protein ACJAZ8_000346 [Planctomycetota bacterium]|jgi:hypothetical protein
MQNEIWRLAQIAFDEGRSPADDAQVLELLLEDPSLMETMDELLLVESKLDAIANLPALAQPKTSPFSRVRLGTIAAGLLIAGLPFLTVDSTPQQGFEGTSSDTPIAGSGTFHNERVAAVPDEGVNSGVEYVAQVSIPPEPSKVPPKSSILSFELSVSETTSAPTRAREQQFPPSTPRPQIRILTSTRTKSALGARTR